jgi:predicted DNA-binding protein
MYAIIFKLTYGYIKMTIRKNFLLEEEIVEQLKKLAQSNNMTQTGIIRELIEKEYQQSAIKERLEALYNFAGSGTGKFTESKK